METYPVVIDDSRVGTLEVQRGLMTRFTASAPDRGRMIRLSCYGGGAEGYLGLMMPDGAGSMTLIKSLSRADMRDFPKEIEYAAPAGKAHSFAPLPARERIEPPETSKKPEEPEDAGAGLLWFSLPDGTLTAFDGKRSLLALPSEVERVPRGAEGIIRRINGREYIVFPR